jgi:hypothetical protein
VTATADGNFVVVWQSSGSTHYSIQGQRYASDGSAQGAQFQVNTYTTHPNPSMGAAYPSVAAEAGGFVVAWQSYGSFGTDTDSLSIQARFYGSDGSAQGPDFQVNTFTASEQSSASVAATDGSFVVAWVGPGSSESDIRGQRYGEAQQVPSLSPRSAALAALLLVAAAVVGLRRCT